MELFRTVLDIDGAGLSVAEKMTRYYGQAGKGGSDRPFCFETLSTRFELAESDIFTEVLRPQTVRDLVGFHLKECIRREMKARICKNCGRYFIIRGRTSARYCDWAIDGGRPCREIGAPRVWEMRKKGEPLFVLYRREYKKRFAWIKAGKLTQEAFYAWSERAREKKAECEAGVITTEEFKLWLNQP